MPVTSPQGTLDFKKVDKITFVGASSNTVIDTTTGSVGIGVVGDALSSNLHVVGDTRMEGNINMLHTSNTASIKLNSNVVTEFPRSKKLIRYPRVAMTTSTISEYTASASTVQGTNYAWHVFDTINPEGSSASRWRSSNYVYTSNSAGSPVSGTAAQLSASSGTPSGEYILLTLPEKMCLKRYSWSGLTTQGPKEGEIWGSNDGSSWSRVHTFTNGNSGWVQAGSSTTDYGNYPDYRDVDEGNVAFYSRYAFIITKLAGADVAASVRELEYYGIPEYDPEADGTDVILKSLSNVPNTDWLEVYYDAKGLTPGAVTNPISGLGGTTISATKLGDPQVSNDAFVFDGLGDAIVSGATSLSGNPPLSYSVWFKTNSISSGSNSIVQIGHAGSATSLGFRIRGSGETTKPENYRFYVYGGATNESVDTDIKAEIGTWTHATVVYNGLNSKLYMDGKFVIGNTNTATNLVLASGAKVALGNYIDSDGALYSGGDVRDYDGSIANFRLFNRALTSDEIYQLYAYQKEYFGHGDLSMTLKAGRLGIGTSEPRAMLDVKGDTFSKVYKGGRTTFLTWDYEGQRYVDISAADHTTYANVGNILDHTFDIPSCYHDLGRATLKAFVQIDWRGEVNKPWNFVFRIEVTYNGDQIAYSSSSDHAASLNSRGCGIPTIGYHEDHYSTPEHASVTSLFKLTDCDVSPGSTLKVQLVGQWGDNSLDQRIWTGRTHGNINRADYELPTSSFFVVLDVDDGY